MVRETFLGSGAGFGGVVGGEESGEEGGPADVSEIAGGMVVGSGAAVGGLVVEEEAEMAAAFDVGFLMRWERRISVMVSS